MDKDKVSVSNLLNSVLLLILGIILLTKSESVINIISWVFGGILALFGLLKILNYFKSRKKSYDYFMSTDLLLGLLLISLGCVLIFSPGIIDISIRVICGGWIIIAGINRLLLGLSIKAIDNKGSKLYIITAILMLLVGIFVLSNLFNIIGIYIIIYSIFDIIGYIYNIKNNNTKKSAKQNTKKVKKSIKEKEAIDIEVEE